MKFIKENKSPWALKLKKTIRDYALNGVGNSESEYQSMVSAYKKHPTRPNLIKLMSWFFDCRVNIPYEEVMQDGKRKWKLKSTHVGDYYGVSIYSSMEKAKKSCPDAAILNESSYRFFVEQDYLSGVNYMILDPEDVGAVINIKFEKRLLMLMQEIEDLRGECPKEYNLILDEMLSSMDENSYTREKVLRKDGEVQ